MFYLKIYSFLLSLSLSLMFDFVRILPATFSLIKKLFDLSFIKISFIERLNIEMKNVYGHF